MYSEAELDSAVAAGTLTREAADALRAHVSAVRNAPLADEEQFRLVTGFNDFFVTIAGILVLVGAGWFGGAIVPSLGGALVAAAAWGMAEFFTRVRRMALPSIVFFLAFVGGVYFTFLGLYPDRMGSLGWLSGVNSRSFLLYQAGATAVTIGACWVHWKRFMVPITIAAGVASIAQLAFTLVAAAFFPMSPNWTLALLLIAGLVIFAYAMHWDSQDRARVTRRSDVAFWLHLSASPMIVHPIFVLMGVNFGMREENATMISIVAIGIYLLLGIVALIVDRRAILVSALVYVLIAAVYLVSQIGIEGAGFAIVIIVIGSSLLMLSAFWQAMRRLIVPHLSEAIQQRVPLLR